MKNNCKKISVKKKVLFKLLLAMAVMFILVSCISKYPIVVHDKDLPKNTKDIIVEVIDRKELEKKEKNQEIPNNTIYNIYDNDIDENFIEYEEKMQLLSNIESSFPVVVLFKNQPDFDLKKYNANAFENYSELDSLGRVGKAEAMLGKETMPTTSRESIGMIKPSGWHTIKYDNVDGKYLFNRCHLIGWQLSAENANEKNLFTGTRYLNTEGMLPFENKVADYIKTTGNHVLYRVTPYFSGRNLVASHVQIEAMSFEDNGQGLCFNVKLDNIQPGIQIDYLNGNSFSETNSNAVNESKKGDAV